MFSEEKNESFVCLTELWTGFLRRGSLNVSACWMLELKIQKPHVGEAREGRKERAVPV